MFVSVLLIKNINIKKDMVRIISEATETWLHQCALFKDDRTVLWVDTEATGKEVACMNDPVNGLNFISLYCGSWRELNLFSCFSYLMENMCILVKYSVLVYFRYKIFKQIAVKMLKCYWWLICVPFINFPFKNKMYYARAGLFWMKSHFN